MMGFLETNFRMRMLETTRKIEMNELKRNL